MGFFRTHWALLATETAKAAPTNEPTTEDPPEPEPLENERRSA